MCVSGGDERRGEGRGGGGWGGGGGGGRGGGGGGGGWKEDSVFIELQPSMSWCMCEICTAFAI